MQQGNNKSFRELRRQVLGLCVRGNRDLDLDYSLRMTHDQPMSCNNVTLRKIKNPLIDLYLHEVV